MLRKRIYIMQKISRKTLSIYGLFTSILLLIFVARVLVQFIQAIYPLDIFPSFESWHSGTLPYQFLLLSQVFIIIICIIILRNFLQNRIIPKRTKGIIYLALGGIYFLFMAIRLLLGLTIASSHSWFGATIPSFFHLILASIVLLLGKFHYTYYKE